MINFGTVRPGSLLRIPFDSFGADGQSITMTGLAAADIEVFKDGGTTARASDAGYTLDDTDGIDFAMLTGIHGFSIDLADNTTAGFYAAGSQYRVVVSAIDIDTQTVRFTAAIFTIGYPQAILNTTIATLASQTSFTLTAGPAEDDALNGMEVLIHDVASAVQLGRAVIADYTGSTKTVTLAAGTTFTVAASDNIAIMGPSPLMPLTAGRGLAVDSTGIADVNVEEWNATSVPAEHTAGYPVVTIKDGTGTGELDTTSGKVSPADGSISSATFAGGTLLDEAGIRAALGLTAANLETLITTVDTVVDTIAARLTATRAGYLDNLSGGAVATAAALTVIDDFLDTEIAAILAIAQKLDSALELDGSVYRFTINALEQAPAGGGGGSTDWTADERTAIRAILGIPASGTTPDDPTTGILDTIRDSTGTLQTSVNDLPTNAELATALASADDAVLTAIDALPTNAELATALGTADDAVLAAIAALSIPTTAAIADAVLDEVVEGTTTVRQLLRGYTAALLNILAGAATTTITVRDLANTKNRITMTVDADGNRSAVTLDLT